MKRTRMTAQFILGALLSGTCLTDGLRAEEALYGAADDTCIYNSGPGWSLINWGVFTQLGVGLNAASQPYRSLLRFDLSGLGSETSVTSATLTLTVASASKLSLDRGNFNLNFFLLDNANKGWAQGNQSAQTAATGEPCWAYRQFDSATWAGSPGIGNSTASDGIAALLGTVMIDVTNTVVGDKLTLTINTAEGLAALQAWSAGGDNAGLFLATDEASGGQNAILFASKEHATSAYRPTLTVHTAAGDVAFGASDDTFIWNGTYYTDTNWGAFNQVMVGLNNATYPYRGLLRFDLGNLRARYTSIDSAELTLTVISTNKITVSLGNFDLRLFLLADANANWAEGTKNAATVSSGEPCWNWQQYGTAGWAGGGGIGNSTSSAGISHLLATVTIDVATITNGQKIVISLSSPEALAALDAWARGGTNAGLLLTTDETSGGMNGLYLGSAEHATAASRPELKVTYTADETAFVASEDNFIYNQPAYTNTNWGSSTTLVIGLNGPTYTYRTLMRFDLGDLARAGKQVKWATLTLTASSLTKITKALGNFDTRLFLLDDANADWSEGSKNAATAGAGESCWRWRQYNTADWTGGQGVGISTNAGIRTLLATATIDVNTFAVGSTVTFYIESPEGLAALESWAGGGTNAGFLLTTDEASGGQNAIQAASGEYTTNTSYRPTLRVVLEPKIPQGTLIRVY